MDRSFEAEPVGYHGPPGEYRVFKCLNCGHQFTVPYGAPRPMQCPKCGAPTIMRIDKGKGRGRGKRWGMRGFKQAKW